MHALHACVEILHVQIGIALCRIQLSQGMKSRCSPHFSQSLCFVPTHHLPLSKNHVPLVDSNHISF